MIDSHCHLADEVFAADLEAVAARGQAAGVVRTLCILAADAPKEAEAANAVRRLWPGTFFAVGIHPHQAGTYAGRPADVVSTVTTAARTQRASAIGEVGLDFHYDFSPRDVQQVVFSAQIKLARQLRLPLVVHSREATDETLRALRIAGGGEARGVFHCFSGDTDMARAVVDLGFHIGVGGLITFPNSREIREAVKAVPEDRLLIETDAPYLAPVPYRGQRNEPAFVARVLEELAALRGVPVAALGAAVVRNFDALFGPSPSAKKA